MSRLRLLLSGFLLLSGCSWPVREQTDQTVRDLVEHPFDISPEPPPPAAKPPAEGPARDGTPAAPAGAHTSDNTPSSSRSGEQLTLRPVDPIPIDVPTTVVRMQSPPDPAPGEGPPKDDQVQTAAWTGSQRAPGPPGGTPPQAALHIPPKVPGSEAPEITPTRPMTQAQRERAIDLIYPELSPLPAEPKVQPGPGGKPYTLADFQRLAAAHSPTLVQAASDVQAARGNLIQAMTYPNPTGAFVQDPTNVNNTAGTQGGYIDQVIITGGKKKLGAAAAQKSLDNAILALKRARMDLSTAVRNAYFAVLVDVETLIVTRTLVQLSDEIYRLQTALVRVGLFAAYEPTALLAQTSINRLAYKQARASYIYDWKALVATLGLPQLPLAEVAGQVDRFIPYYDYDDVRNHVLQNHTDVLTARNGVQIAQYNLKLAQVTPLFPDLDVNLSLEKVFAVSPFGTYQQQVLGFPAPIWDQNKGNIIAAQGALVRAGEESHRVEVTLTNNLALAYQGYRNNLYAIEYYRRNILPDLVRYYRGVFARRQSDLDFARQNFGDLVFAQQNLSTNVTAYIDLLRSLWSSVVSVANFLQTDDLYQLAQKRELPQLPDFKQLQPPHWLCGHDGLAASHASLPPGGGAFPLPPGGGGSGRGGGEKTTPLRLPPSRGESQSPTPPTRGGEIQTVAWTQTQPGPGAPGATQRKLELEVPPRLPGSEAPQIVLPRAMTPAQREREVGRTYPELPPLSVEPKVQPGPGGKPYTLADFQRLAAAHSPTLRQAAADVQAGRGNLIQAMTYTNPTVSYMDISSNNGNTAMAVGGAVDQPISTGGKQKLGVAAAQMALDNAVLALKRARSDLSTAVRNAYFTVLVDVETLIVTRSLVQFSDEIYRLQTGLLRGAQASFYEPTALRAQTYLNRLAYKQAIASYIYDWKALVATLGLPQLPLAEIAGRVDRFIPYYDYDEVRASILQNHTDVLTARNGVKIAQYNLKLAQVTPLFPDLDVLLWWNKDFGNPPHGMYQDVRLGFPLPIWDQNKGNIIAAQAALVRAGEESHRVEVTLTNRLALAYQGYRNNLYAMEYYRRNILPDLVRYYRGVFARRQSDPSSAFGDLVFAQQNLSTNVTAYLGILGSLWSSVVSVADFLQTDDLYQLKRRQELPELPDFTQLPHWACNHAALAASCANAAGGSGPAAAAPRTGLP